ncbi:hypothetical protein ACRALDRAFT_2055366 [Sodiomyces alcalophilus JCM 7366]|uniref:uncharacterized protein n=1 Tax=Sodiomyces alcalophilus JCM 7366 TaxID=591952 RepID=UPI0039B36661
MGVSIPFFALIAGAASLQAQAHGPGAELNTTVSSAPAPTTQETVLREPPVSFRCGNGDAPEDPETDLPTPCTRSTRTTSTAPSESTMRFLQSMVPQPTLETVIIPAAPDKTGTIKARGQYDRPDRKEPDDKITFIDKVEQDDKWNEGLDRSGYRRLPGPGKTFIETWDKPSQSPVLPLGWRLYRGQAEIYGGQLHLAPDAEQQSAYVMLYGGGVRDLEVTATVTIKKGLVKEKAVGSQPAAGVFIRVMAPSGPTTTIGKGVFVGLSAEGWVFVQKVDKGRPRVVHQRKVNVYEQRTYTIKFRMKGGMLTFWLDNMSIPVMKALVPGFLVGPGGLGLNARKALVAWDKIQVKNIDDDWM